MNNIARQATAERFTVAPVQLRSGRVRYEVIDSQTGDRPDAAPETYAYRPYAVQDADQLNEAVRQA